MGRHSTYVLSESWLCLIMLHIISVALQHAMKGTMKGDLEGLESLTTQNGRSDSASGGSGGGGFFSMFKSLSGGKTITRESMEPVLEKMKEHLIGQLRSCDIKCCLLQ